MLRTEIGPPAYLYREPQGLRLLPIQVPIANNQRCKKPINHRWRGGRGNRSWQGGHLGLRVKGVGTRL